MPRHDPVSPLPRPTPDPRPGALRLAFGSRGGARERDPASPGRHPAPASQASRVPDLGQGVPHRREQAAQAGRVGIVPGPTRDALAMAPPARVQEVDSGASPSGTPFPRSRGSRTHSPAGKGEPQVGLHADPWRAAQTRHPGLCHHDRDGPPPFRSGSGSQARPRVERVPPPAGSRDARVRLPHRGDHHAEDAARAGVDRARDEESASGWSNAFCERWVGTLRAECLDWTLILGRRHLERVLRTYVRHYNEARPHRGLELRTPRGDHPRAALPLRRTDIGRRDVLGGLIHEYSLAA
jgi:hypothetical protein